MTSETVSVKPVAPYVGGKSLLAKDIIRRIEAIPHTCYAEPFVGMGGVFLRRPQASKVEVINDISRDDFALLAELLKTLKGRFILSLNDTPGVRETFAEFQIETVKTTYSVNSGSPKPTTEVIISNG